VFKSAANFETNPGKVFLQDQTYYFKDGGNFKAENQSPIYIGTLSLLPYLCLILSIWWDFKRPGEPLVD
jgi:hypothetical protein